MKKLLTILIFIVSCGGELVVEQEDGISSNEYRVFASSQTFNGNLGGISGANAKCQSLAQAAGLVKNYQAIISTDSSDVVNRLQFIGTIFQIDSNGNKTAVLENPNLLWDTSSDLDTSISVDENGNFVSGNVWSGSLGDGIGSFNDCSNWSSSSGNGNFGDSSQVSNLWIFDNSTSCNNSFRIYCINQ